MKVKAFPSGPFSTNAYVLSCEKTQEAVIIDPAPDSFSKISAYIEGEQLKIVAILLTHSHWDHIFDAAKMKRHFSAPVYVHPLDEKNLRVPGADQLPCPFEVEGTVPDHLCVEGESICFGEQALQVLETPGHTPGGVCFYNKAAGILMSGDTLFKQSIGNLSFPTSEPEKMWSSLAKLGALPPETLVYPGHGRSTTIANERWLSQAKEIFGNSY